VNKQVQQRFTECCYRVLGDLFSPERIDDCIAGWIVDDRLRCEEVLFRIFQELKEIPRKVLRIDQCGLVVYPGDLESCDSLEICGKI